jgi:GntR family transcriptional regulator / MocR family aminotransferase
MTTLPSGLPVVLDRDGRQPLALQVSAQLQAAVTSGALRAGDRLPSSRDLAATLGVSRTVVTNAYARLFAEGWLEGRHGSGTYVADVTAAEQWLNRAPGRGQSAGSGANSAPERFRVPPTRPSSVPGSFDANAPSHPSTAQLPSAAAPESATEPTAPDATGPRRGLQAGDASGPRRGLQAGDASGPRRGLQAGDASGPRHGQLVMIDLQPGISWAEGIDPASWRRAWRQAGAHLPSRWPDPHGLPELREEIAAYLRRSRGLAVTPAHVLVTQGVSSGLALLADALLVPGEKAGMEEPGYPTGREVLRRAGAQVVPCRVDAHGIVPEELSSELKLLYTTPAHQYPLGGRLPVNRRQSLIAWARATGALVVEDDYDSEFRYDVGPLPALHSMDPDVIVYLGTASKVLATAFGAGWLVAPPELVERLAALRPRLGVRIPEPVQHAILALLRSGDLERHVRKMRLEYARRRAALVDALTRPPTPPRPHPGSASPGTAETAAASTVIGPAKVPFRLLGDTAGMHLVLELPDGYPVGRLVEAAAQRGVAVYSLTRYFVGPPAVNGLILGYGAATLPQVRRAATELAGLLTHLP